MSSDIFKFIATDPRWQPTHAQAERAREHLARIAPPPHHRRAYDIVLSWHDAIEFVDCGSNLETITCPWCRTTIDIAWWTDQLSARYDDGFDDLTTTAPCCDRACSLNELGYAWPCGFARFQIEIWNPEREPLTAEELAALGDTLGHQVHQVIAHV